MRDVLLVQGAGAGAHREDAALAAALGQALGAGFAVRFPPMPDEADPNVRAWSAALRGHLEELGEGAVLVGHSVGGTVLAATLAAAPPPRAIGALALLAAPFVGPGGWEDAAFGFTLPPDLGERLPRETPVFLYHGTADGIVPLAHLDLWARAIPQAARHALSGRNHQLDGDLSELAADLRGLP